MLSSLLGKCLYGAYMCRCACGHSCVKVGQIIQWLSVLGTVVMDLWLCDRFMDGDV